ncbi:MAG: Arylsulfatase [bacterium]|nr:Arylsulfatase [bacterium]
MRYRLFKNVSLWFWLGGVVAALAARPPQAKSSPPNILLVLVDDLRADALSATGHPFFKSPNIDRIANEGVLFQNAFVTHSLCSPSRATLLTGLYTHQHRVYENNNTLDPRLATVPKILQAAGYETALIGKWHMGYRDDQPKPGFNRWVSFVGQGEYIDPMLNVDGQELKATGHMTDILTNYALEFISRDRQQPFMLFLSHKAVHSPFKVQPQFVGAYDSVNVSLPPTFGETLFTKPAFLQDYAKIFKVDFKTRTRQYYECLAGVEESIGKILAKLAEKNILDNTIIVFIGDNGAFLGEHNLGDKRLAYEESIRIPLFIRYPQWFAAGMKSAEFALNLDMAPTLLEAAGVANTLKLPGISLRKLATGAAQRSSFLYEYFYDPITPQIPVIRAIRTRDYKYITYEDADAMDELYDMRHDSIELNNLINNPDHFRALKRLRFQLDSLRRASGDIIADTSGEQNNNGSPAAFELLQNHPNPFATGRVTAIRYTLRKASPIRLEVFDATGRKVVTLIDGIKNPGSHVVRWNAGGHATGIYFYRLTAPAFVQTKKMIVLTK